MDIKLCALFCIWIFRYVSAAEHPYSANGETPDHWIKLATSELNRAKKIKPNVAVAKNVLIFLGDGTGMSTVTAARILKGQLHYKTGEEEILSFEKFPHVGLSKTYNQDAQIADSSGTATAFFSGIKTNYGLIGCDARARRGECASMVSGSKLKGILHWSLDAGKSVGLVTTTRVTHATPAALYAHSPRRTWENDADIDDHAGDCKDIAAQLIDDNIDIQVILGGGREKFMKNNTTDPQSGRITRGRTDSRDLLQEWQLKQEELGRSYRYVWNTTTFKYVDPGQTDYLLGGRIDHAHHYSQAVRALHDTLAFAGAVEKGVSMTSEKDTLIITTADHSHTFSLGGYPTRGNPIFGVAGDGKGHSSLAKDRKPFTTLGYANGPGGYAKKYATVRPDLTHVNTADMDYRQQSGVPLVSETHGGENVVICAQGPMSHLFHDVHEQHYIAHVMAYASCVGGYSSADSCAASDVEAIDSGLILESNLVILVFATLLRRFV